jgi:hypothetical protein
MLAYVLVCMYVCILHSIIRDCRSRNKFEWRKFCNQSTLIVTVLEAIVTDRLSLVFSVEGNLDGHIFNEYRTSENNCGAMARNTEHGIITAGNREDFLRQENILKSWRE